jgi:Flp pilus assembly protein TadD
LVRRDPAYVEALELLGDHYTLRGRARESLTVDQRLRALRPDDPNVRFNLACSLALSGNPEGACAELEQALALGFRDFRMLQRDPDLAAARKHPAFKRVKEKAKALKVEIR